MLGEVQDAMREQRHLDLGRTGVAVADGILGDDLLLGLDVSRHSVAPTRVSLRGAPGHVHPGTLRSAAVGRPSQAISAVRLALIAAPRALTAARHTAKS